MAKRTRHFKSIEENVELEIKNSSGKVDVRLILNGKEIYMTLSSINDYVLVHNGTTDFNDVTLSESQGVKLSFKNHMIVTKKN